MSGGVDQTAALNSAFTDFFYGTDDHDRFRRRVEGVVRSAREAAERERDAKEEHIAKLAGMIETMRSAHEEGQQNWLTEHARAEAAEASLATARAENDRLKFALGEAEAAAETSKGYPTEVSQRIHEIRLAALRARDSEEISQSPNAANSLANNSGSEEISAAALRPDSKKEGV